AIAPAGTRFTGLHATNQADLGVYLALIEEARRGHFLLHNLFTPEPHPGIQVRPLYELGGLLAALGASNLLAYHLLRVLAVLAFVPALHALARRFLASPRERLAAVLLACFASGLGWLAPLDAPREALSVDLWMPEAVTFASLYESPHFTLSLALLALLLAWTQDALEGPATPPARLALGGALALLLALEHPYDIFMLLPVVALAVAARRRGLAWLVALGAGAGVGLGAIWLRLR